MLKIIQSRTKLVDVTIFPVLVQGSDAALDMANTLDMINRDFPHMDLLILGRGGGSAEDLWAFNEEVLARAVYRSEIPIISAVGHEIDFSITDFVADMRAETPTAAAEKAVPDDEMLLKEIARLKRDLLAQLKSKVDYYQLLSEKHIGDISRSLEYKIEDLKHRLKHSLISLEENNPLNILSKGYNIMEDDGGSVISSYKSLEPQKKYKIYFKDGSVEVTLSDIITLSETKREGE
jgi:exodeoxyribonuclease VII large subunit